jgi:peptidoglycan hydrolase-like protein with peptidoglycan-binding domain
MRERVASYIEAAGGRLPQAQPELLKEDSAGEAVRQLQVELSALGYISFPDGKYGPNTVSAVKKFQRANGLEEDGVAGPQTMDVLRSDRAVPYARESSEDLLRDRGSKTIAAADAQNVTVMATTLVAGAGAVLETTQQASTVAEGAWTLLTEKWWIVLLLVGMFVVYRLAERIKAARVEAARSGENLSK